MTACTYKFNHIGVPTNTPQENEVYFEALKLYATDPDKTPFNIEYLRPAEGCTFFPVLLNNPHVSYQVEDLEKALEGQKVVVEPFSPMPGRTIAFIDVNGFIIELSYDE